MMNVVIVVISQVSVLIVIIGYILSSMGGSGGGL